MKNSGLVSKENEPIHDPSQNFSLLYIKYRIIIKINNFLCLCCNIAALTSERGYTFIWEHRGCKWSGEAVSLPVKYHG